MATISVIYHSGTGHTKLMAEAVLEGVRSEDGAKGQLYAVEGPDIVEGRWRNPEILEALDDSDAIIFGSPTYMGCMSGQMKSFLDATLDRYYSRAWADKIPAAFTISATPSGDKLGTLTAIALCAMQLGMIWVGQGETPQNEQGMNRLSFYLGAGGQAEFGGPETAIQAQDRATGVELGARVARITRALTAG